MEEIIMRVNELLMNIRNKSFKLQTGLQIKQYLPIREKQAIAHLIINECTDEVNGVIELDSMQQYLSYVKHMILMHTNLDYSDEDYDKLCSTEYMETNLLNAIMSCFGPDAEECSRILNLMLDDYMRRNSIEHMVGKFLNSLNNAVDNLAASLSNFDISSVVPKDLDIERFNQMLKQYVK
jgi:hypothetical protein